MGIKEERWRTTCKARSVGVEQLICELRHTYHSENVMSNITR